jgi:sodium transport system permease protein
VSLLPLLSVLNQEGESPWHLAVPALAQVTLMGRVLKSETIAPLELVVPVLVCALVAVLCLSYVARSLRRAAVR